MDVSTLEPKLQEMVRVAVDIKQHAYCPYSKFRVGSSVLCPDGTIYAGCNVENASYGLSVCAERNAVMKAVSEGHRKFIASAVSCDTKNEFPVSCGVCRQVYAEFGLEIDIYMIKPDMTFKKLRVRDLLPMAFTPESLESERI